MPHLEEDSAVATAECEFWGAPPASPLGTMPLYEGKELIDAGFVPAGQTRSRIPTVSCLSCLTEELPPAFNVKTPIEEELQVALIRHGLMTLERWSAIRLRRSVLEEWRRLCVSFSDGTVARTQCCPENASCGAGMQTQHNCGTQQCASAPAQCPSTSHCLAHAQGKEHNLDTLGQQTCRPMPLTLTLGQRKCRPMLSHLQQASSQHLKVLVKSVPRPCNSPSREIQRATTLQPASAGTSQSPLQKRNGTKAMACGWISSHALSALCAASPVKRFTSEVFASSPQSTGAASVLVCERVLNANRHMSKMLADNPLSSRSRSGDPAGPGRFLSDSRRSCSLASTGSVSGHCSWTRPGSATFSSSSPGSHRKRKEPHFVEVPVEVVSKAIPASTGVPVPLEVVCRAPQHEQVQAENCLPGNAVLHLGAMASP